MEGKMSFNLDHTHVKLTLSHYSLIKYIKILNKREKYKCHEEL